MCEPRLGYEYMPIRTTVLAEPGYGYVELAPVDIHGDATCIHNLEEVGAYVPGATAHGGDFIRWSFTVCEHAYPPRVWATAARGDYS